MKARQLYCRNVFEISLVWHTQKITLVLQVKIWRIPNKILEAYIRLYTVIESLNSSLLINEL